MSDLKINAYAENKVKYREYMILLLQGNVTVEHNDNSVVQSSISIAEYTVAIKLRTVAMSSGNLIIEGTGN